MYYNLQMFTTNYAVALLYKTNKQTTKVKNIQYKQKAKQKV